MKQYDLRPLQADIAQVDINGFSDIADWNINSTDFEAKATIRERLATTYKHLSDEFDYDESKAGYRAYVYLPFVGTIAFIPDNSNEPVYRW